MAQLWVMKFTSAILIPAFTRISDSIDDRVE